MIKFPKKLWTDCLTNHACIRPFAARYIYVLKGEIPDTLVNGETPYISDFTSLKWYEWITFWDQQIA